MLFTKKSGLFAILAQLMGHALGCGLIAACLFLSYPKRAVGQCVYVRSDPVNGTINVPINHPITVFYQAEHLTDRCAPLFLYQQIDYPGTAPVSIDIKSLLNDQWHRAGSHLFYGRIVFQPREGALRPHTTYLLQVHHMTIARFITHLDEHMVRGHLLDSEPLAFHVMNWRGLSTLSIKHLDQSDQVWLNLDWPFLGPQQRQVFLKNAQLFFQQMFHRGHRYPVAQYRLHFLSVLPSGTLGDQYATVFIPLETREARLPGQLPLWVVFPSSFETIPANFYEWLGAQVASQGRVLMVFNHQEPMVYASSMNFSHIYQDARRALTVFLGQKKIRTMPRPTFFGGGDGALNAFWSVYHTEMMDTMQVPRDIYLYAGLFDVFRTMRFYFSESLLFGHFQNPSNLLNFSVMHTLLSRYLLGFSTYWGFEFSAADVFAVNGFPQKEFVYQFLANDNALTRELVFDSPVGTQTPWPENDLRFSVYDSGQDHVVPSDNTKTFFVNFLRNPYHFRTMRYVSCFNEHVRLLYQLGVLPYHDLCALFVWNDALNTRSERQ